MTGSNSRTGIVARVNEEKKFGFVDIGNDSIFIPPPIMVEHSLKNGDELLLSTKITPKGLQIDCVLEINGDAPSKPSVPRKLFKKIKQALRYRPTFALSKLYLAFTAGASDQKMIEMLAGAQESLKPFLEYSEQSIKAAEHQRRVLRFNWTHVPESMRIRIRPEFTRLLASIDCFDYRTTMTDLNAGEVLYAEGDETLSKVTNVGVSLDDGTIPFSTENPLDNHDTWKRLDQGLQKLQFETKATVPEVENIIVDDKPVEILSQSVAENQLEIILFGCIETVGQVVVNGERVEARIEPPSSHGVLKDGSTAVIVRGDSLGRELDALSTPSSETLFDENQLPFSWHRSDGKKRNRGHTLKLDIHPDVAALLDKSQDDDPYDMIFSPNRELRMMEIEGKWNKSDRFEGLHEVRVYRRNRENQTITVERIPEEGSVLTSAPRTRLIRAQRDMIEELKHHSLPHNRALLKLLAPGDQSKREKLWKQGEPKPLRDEPEWMVLVENSDGTETQREMVRIALSSRDISILQGPPGSGKSTTILEIVLQAIIRGENVLLCGSTQASIDNVLGRIIRDSRFTEIISPVRIGSEDNLYDDDIKPLSLSAQKRHMKDVFDLTDSEASGLILSSSNLTCGTMEGILGHPWIKETRRDSDDSTKRDSFVSKSPQPHWDMLIIDECSKTTFNEFIVPAMFCRRFVLVGDIRQLPPFTQEGEFQSNLENIKNFGIAEQRAMLLNHQLQFINKPGRNDPSILLVERSDVVNRLVEEWSLRGAESLPQLDMTVVISGGDESKRPPSSDSIRVYSEMDVLNSFEVGIEMMTSPIIIIDESSLKRVQHILPRMPVAWSNKVDKNEFSIMDVRSQAHTEHRCFVKHNRDLAGRPEVPEWSDQMSWRLTRLSELKHSKNQRKIDNYNRAIDGLMPNFVDITEGVDLIRLIALPSVMECLQEGFRRRGESEESLESTLTHGLPLGVIATRFKMLEFQHRMEPGISAFPRDEFYKGEALIDADTIHNRKESEPFTYRRNLPDSIWLNIRGHRVDGWNKMEVSSVKSEISEAIEWARNNAPTEGETWEFAILTPYSRQYSEIARVVKEMTGIHDRSFRFDLREMKRPAPVTLMVSSTDKFQGQEADIVIISLVQTHGHGFLDSPNRMNVALTRAKRKRIIIGRHGNFLDSKDEMLQNMAKIHVGDALIN